MQWSGGPCSHREGYGGTEGEPVQHAGKNFHTIRLIARRHDIALPGTPAVQLGLYHFARERHPGRAAIYHNTNAHTVGFSPGADSESGTE